MKYNVIHYEEIDSTNTEARRLSLEGAESGLVVVADKQSAGKGRRGRSWESPAGENLYFSLLLRPQLVPEKAPMLTLVMAYSVAKVLRDEDVSVQIKWPNDLVLGKRKICGILTEMHLQGCEIEDVIVGVGINVNTTKFPDELQDKATSIYLETNRVLGRDVLLQKILAEFQKQYERFLQVEDLSFMKESYNQMLINRNQEVMVLEPGNEFSAIALGMNELGELLVKRENGDVETVFAGEVSVRGLYGYV